MRHRIVTLVLFAAFALLISSCASSGRGSTGRADQLTRAQLDEMSGISLYDAVRQLRPRWLNPGSNRSFSLPSEVVVIQGQSVLGGVEYLRQLSVNYPQWLEYMDGQTASSAFPGMGGRHVAGAIIIHMSPR